MDTPGVSGSSGSKQKTPLPDAFQKLDVEQFLKLLITELQNQDPLSPADNQQLLQQIGEIKNIAASNKLTETLEAVQLNDSVSSAAGLIGKHVSGLDDAGDRVDGKVDKVSISDGQPRVLVGSKSVRMANISEVRSD